MEMSSNSSCYTIKISIDRKHTSVTFDNNIMGQMRCVKKKRIANIDACVRYPILQLYLDPVYKKELTSDGWFTYLEI
jgi:hypothetical protein